MSLPRARLPATRAAMRDAAAPLRSAMPRARANGEAAIRGALIAMFCLMLRHAARRRAGACCHAANRFARYARRRQRLANAPRAPRDAADEPCHAHGCAAPPAAARHASRQLCCLPLLLSAAMPFAPILSFDVMLRGAYFC